MPSEALLRCRTTRAGALDEIAQAHAAIGGTARGRRRATQQVNRAYAVLLASQFQGFCRDPHSACVDHLLTMILDPRIQLIARAEMMRGRQLDRGNAQSSSIGADFGRIGINFNFWHEASAHDAANADRQILLEGLNLWRNAIVHQDLDAGRLGGSTMLRLEQVRAWRRACNSLATSFDEVARLQLLAVTGAAPW